MENISRRRALALLPAAGAAIAVPAVALAAEAPDAKAFRLQAELADALNDAFGGRFGAEVFPSRDIPHDLGGKFFDLASHCRQWREAREALAFVEFAGRGTPLGRARWHSQQLTLALREHHGYVGVKSAWLGDDVFIVSHESAATRAAAVMLEERGKRKGKRRI